jgi:hypothetical protein
MALLSMGYANSMSNDKLMTSADRFSHVQHSQYDIAELRLSSAAAQGRLLIAG